MMKKLIPLFLSLLLFSCFSTKRTAKKLYKEQQKVKGNEVKPKIITFEQTSDSTTIYDFVEERPEFPGGQTKLNEFIEQNLNYPKGEHTQGTVYVKFVVEKNGTITNIEIARGLSSKYDQEVINLIKKMPKWISGKQRKKSVRCRMILPIKFK
ncbi:MAG: energy transducer TonB [Flavobacteriales bacterium]